MVRICVVRFFYGPSLSWSEFIMVPIGKPRMSPLRFLNDEGTESAEVATSDYGPSWNRAFV